MSITWPASFPQMVAVSGWVEPDGKVLLQFARNALAASPRWRMFVVAEADGAVHNAFADTNFDHPTWAIAGSSQSAGVRQGRYIFKVQRKDIVPPYEEAAVGGALAELHPKPLHVWDPSNGHAFAAASGLWATRDPSEIRFAKWGEPLGSPITSGEVGGGELQSLFPLGDMLFFKRQPFPSADIWAYKEGVGVYPLVAFGGDPDKNVDGFGSDGTHMVWVETQVNWPPDVTPFEVGPRDVMVSPYAETAAGLAPVRLRSFPSIYPLTSAMAVGCGYAAHGGIDVGKGWLFRLSDGYSWELPMAGCTPPNLSNDICLQYPLAITCDEVFVPAVGKVNTIVRLSINALGPPTPPD
jgi:hypothetical protein